MDTKKAILQKTFFVVATIMVVFIISSLSACDNQKKTEESGKKLDFTVCHDENLPKELKELIEQKKEKPFKLSYSTKEYTYITVGYGQQTMGGYSIQVLDVSVTDQSVIMKTVLKGPKAEEEKKGVSYPYIVVKIQNMDKPVSFR